MKNKILIILIISVFLVFLTVVSICSNINKKGVYNMKVTSNSFQNNTLIPIEHAYTYCGGKNVSPDLKWDDIPADTKSFAIIVHDPDAPRANGWYHWLVVDIPADKTSIEKGEKISGARELKNDFQQTSYGGPCPPSGQHRYNFNIYALDVEKLDVSENDLPKTVEQIVIKHSIGKAVLTGLYKH